MSYSTTAGGNHEYFKVCWTQVLELVRNKKVFLCDGFAYVIQSDVIFGVCQMFRSELSLELTVSYFTIFLKTHYIRFEYEAQCKYVF